MRGYIFSIALLLVLALAESSLLPATLGSNLRPNVVLIVTAVWASMRGSDGFALALAGGFMLDLVSSVPMGLSSLSMLLGNAIATVLNRAPIPSPLFHTTTWVAIVTVVSHSIILTGIAVSGQQLDVVYATTNVILPLLIVNPLLSIPVFFLARAIKEQLRRQDIASTALR